ncbi:MAG TPA: efflux RND transporter periplasmic adaptor subunit [Kofleriaceae bacterium]|nr:efflux RND transporter periplasmic adaptor subunit [Kofleriaceae bacterium]
MRSLLCISLLLVACKGDGHSHEADQGHPHGGDELPGQSVTLWTAKHELFMEYRPLVVGQEVGFAAHVTALPAFKALERGTVTVQVSIAGAPPLAGRADVAKPAGIFRPTLRPDGAGACKLTVTIEDAAGTDTIDAGACEVFATADDARRKLGAEEETPGRITYLKEQAWKTEFATLPVAERDLQPGVRCPGEIRPVAGREARLTSPTPGRVALADPPPVLGMAVQKGQLLASVAPRVVAGGDRPGLEGDVATARAELDAANAAVARAERLLADQAIPAKQLEEARTRARVAQARLDAASGRLGQYAATVSGGGGKGAFQIKSPIDGTLVAVDAASGQIVEEGASVFVVMDLERVWLEVQVFEPDIPKVEHAKTAWFTIEGYDQPFQLDDSNGRVVTLGRVLDPETRTVPLIFELANPQGKLRVGQFAKVVVATGDPVRALAIPESAIVEDAGKPVAFVQVEGEAFERRPLTLGLRSNGWVEVKDGLAAGERVVTRGAYEIKLASAAGSIPAHGHVH